MPFGGGWGGWLGPLVMLALVIGVVLVVWAAQTGDRPGDDALATLRARFARGEIDAEQFEAMRRTLGVDSGRRRTARTGTIGLVLVGAAIGLAIVMSWWGPGWGWMGQIMGVGARPTAPAGTSVTMAGSRFAPSTLTLTAGDVVRWFNDDALPHTVSASEGDWDSGNLAPGQGFERRFDEPGSYPYLCRYHPGMVGTIVVEA